MHFLALAAASTAIFFAATTSATPVPRQPPSAYYVIVDEELGTAWTVQNDYLIVAGNPIGLSAFSTSYVPETQIFAVNQVMSGGNVLYYFQSAMDLSLYVSTVQTTSSANYSPGYSMLQTSIDNPTYFTLTPGPDGGYYFSPATEYLTPQPNLQLCYYYYDSTTAPFIPIIIDGAEGGTARSFSIRGIELEY